LTLDEGESCSEARVCLGVLGLTARRVPAAEDALRGQSITAREIGRVRQAVMDIAEPASDMRGSADYKRHAAGALAQMAVEAAVKRALGDHVEVSHLYA
jgi:aerobic carbon-monoxide dehydrogenase medium subunit